MESEPRVQGRPEWAGEETGEEGAASPCEGNARVTLCHISSHQGLGVISSHLSRARGIRGISQESKERGGIH